MAVNFIFCVEPSRKNLLNSMQKIILGRRQICNDYSIVSVSLNAFSGSVAASRCIGTTIEVSSKIHVIFTIEFRFIIFISYSIFDICIYIYTYNTRSWNIAWSTKHISGEHEIKRILAFLIIDTLQGER